MSTVSISPIKEFYRLLAAGDVKGVLTLLHNDLQWTDADAALYYDGKMYSPQDVLKKLLIPVTRQMNDFPARADEFIVESDRVVTLGAYSGTCKKTGKSLYAPFAHLWRVRNGKITQFDMHIDMLLIPQTPDVRH